VDFFGQKMKLSFQIFIITINCGMDFGFLDCNQLGAEVDRYFWLS